MTLAYARAVVDRHRIVALAALLLALPIVFLVSYFLPRTYTATASLLLSNQKSDASSELTTVLTTLAKSSAVLERVRTSTNDAVPIARLQQNVKARLYGTILKITYTDSHPALAVAVPNAVVDSLVSYYNNLASQQYASTTARLQTELGNKKVQLHDLDRRFQALSAAGIPVDAENPAGNAEIASSISALRAQRIQAEDTLRSDQAYGSGAPSLPPAKPDVSTNPVYGTLASALQRDEALLATSKAQYTAAWPGLAEIENRIATERRQLATLHGQLVASGAAPSSADFQANEASSRSSALIAADHAKLDAIDSQIATLSSSSSKLVGSRVVIETLKAERASVVAQFDALSSSLATALASRANAQNYGTLSVIDRATYADVAGLNSKIVAFIDILIALAIAFAATLIAERIDPRVGTLPESPYGRSVITQTKL